MFCKVHLNSGDEISLCLSCFYYCQKHLMHEKAGSELPCLPCCIYIFIKLIKIKEKQQVGVKVPKFLVDAFLGGLFFIYICLIFWHPPSKLCHCWWYHRRSIPYLHASIYWNCPNKSHAVSTLGKISKYFPYSVCESSTALSHACRHVAHLPWVDKK